MNKKDLKTKFEADFKIVQNEVNLFDPFGLIKGGAPDDEFDFLTNLILKLKIYFFTLAHLLLKTIMR